MSKVLARIKRAMKRGEDDILYLPSCEESWKWFSIINKELFQSKLAPPAEIAIKRQRGSWGQCWDDHHIWLNDKFPNVIIFLSVLAHEMIHLFQIQQGEPWGHGKSFEKWRNRFIKHGLIFKAGHF